MATTINDQLVSKTRSMFAASIAVKQEVMESQVEIVVQMAELISRSLQNGGKLLLCGNGGSAADAQHLAAELLVRLRPQVDRDGIPALALATDTSSLTACGNDYSFEVYYERLVTTLGKPGDVLMGITTSGRSSNIVRALHAARAREMVTLGLLGSGGGDALAECDLALVVPSDTTARIQEAHITIGHALMELVEDLLFDSAFLASR
ncbi:MAG TPA: SIS domain-containing protein [Pyrinomonadaceae bacterium]|jgi:D-sedoheptulose 7-phosphate isomerase|nr:SIS domain-containing protein [Pyrinomonadaceae bacterium]